MMTAASLCYAAKAPTLAQQVATLEGEVTTLQAAVKTLQDQSAIPGPQGPVGPQGPQGTQGPAGNAAVDQWYFPIFSNFTIGYKMGPFATQAACENYRVNKLPQPNPNVVDSGVPTFECWNSNAQI